MARPSKVKSPPKHAQFAVFVDPSIPTNSTRQPSSNDDVEGDSELDVSEYPLESKKLEDIAEDLTPASFIGEQTDTEIDYDNGNDDDEGCDQGSRELDFARGASISSLPESSVFDTDYDDSSMQAMHKPYTPPSMRPTFRRPMASPSPYERNSPRRSALRIKSRSNTPRSVKQSPRPRGNRRHEEEEAEAEKEYPLVLLHVTLLPVELRWSAESMLEVLPPNVIENLQLLRSKVSETILHRGILIPHPREEYELLEDRLLEALELKKERVTKCGHFRARSSASSSSSAEGSVKSADSGVAFNIDDEEVEQCATCNSPVKSAAIAADVHGSKWSIKVFAANGLMRAPAWTAAWSEMERVDVEILPWINEGLRKQLDTMAEREEADERQRREEEEAHIKQVVEEQVRIAHEERKRLDEEERARSIQYSPMPLDVQPEAGQKPPTQQSHLPQVYRAADIPLSMLLKNYIFLLAQDKRNVAMFALAMLAFWLSLRGAVSQAPILDFAAFPSVNAVPRPTMLAPSHTTKGNADVLDVLPSISTMIEEARDTISDNSVADVLVPQVDTIFHQEDRKTPEAVITSSVTSAMPSPTALSAPLEVHKAAAPSPSTDTMQDKGGNYRLASEMFSLPVCLP